MGKPVGKSSKKKTGEPSKKSKKIEPQPNSGEDMAVFVDMARDLKEDGNKLFQKRDYKGAILAYEKALKLLPASHAEISSLCSNLAACYMQLDPPDYHRAVENCNLALEISPKYSKALLKRARCYEAVDRLDFAIRDVEYVLSSEPTNATAQEISDRIKKAMDLRGIKLQGAIPEPTPSKTKSKPKKKKTQKAEELPPKEEAPKAEPLKVKLVLGEDIRFAVIPSGCSILHLRETVRQKFPNTEGVLIKYKDEEGDLVTITTTEELRWAEETGSSLKLFISLVNPDQDPLFLSLAQNSPPSVKENGSYCVEEWVVLFAQLFKDQLGFSVDEYLDLHQMGAKLYSEAMEEVLEREDARKVLNLAESKFQEMAALALFNWGNVHLSKGEYQEAGQRFEQAVEMKPDFYEGFIALAAGQFEQAKLLGREKEMEREAMALLDKAEENVEKGAQLWEDMEEKRLREILQPGEEKALLQKMGLMDLLKEISTDEAAEQATRMKAQINILRGSILYERSVIEFKLEIPLWEDSLAMALENFKAAGASPTDLAVMAKNHCSNSTAQEGLVFRIEEIVQAWNEMYDARRWASRASSFRLEPLFRRRLPKLHHNSL